MGYSKESSQWDGSFEHPKLMFKLMGKKIITILHFFILFHSAFRTQVKGPFYTIGAELPIWTTHSSGGSRRGLGPRGLLKPPPLPPVFKYPTKMKSFGLTENQLIHFHGIFKKNEIKSAKLPPPLYTSEPSHPPPPPPLPEILDPPMHSSFLSFLFTSLTFNYWQSVMSSQVNALWL